MRYALMTEPQQGLSYDEILAVARTAAPRRGRRTVPPIEQADQLIT